MHDIAVVGLGMMGAAATRHLASIGVDVLGIGPGEPEDWQAHGGVFSSHYDEARITRILDPDPIWAKLAECSIARYAGLEAESGIHFHVKVGGLRATPDITHPRDSVAAARRIGQEWGVEFQTLDQAEMAREFPFWSFPEGSIGLWEQGDAGYVNPRRMVVAQLVAAQKHGATLMRETVVQVRKNGNGYEVTTDKGSRVSVRSVLVTAGGYTNHILPRPLDLRPRPVIVLLGELGPGELDRLAGMPTLIYRMPQDDYLYSIYALPPVPYPDGKTYIKMGAMAWEMHLIHEPQEFVEWFHGDGDPAEIQALHRAFREIVPGLQAESWLTKPCILTDTASGYPYIDEVDDGLFVATGGNGYSAKSCDEIGRLGAQLAVQRQWIDDMDPVHFKAHFRPEGAPPRVIHR